MNEPTSKALVTVEHVPDRRRLGSGGAPLDRVLRVRVADLDDPAQSVAIGFSGPLDVRERIRIAAQPDGFVVDVPSGFFELPPDDLVEALPGLFPG